MAELTIGQDGWAVRRIDFPHAGQRAVPEVSGGIRQRIVIIVRETQKGQTVNAIAQKYGLEPDFVEQVARLYVTHPGVSTDGIMTKMGL